MSYLQTIMADYVRLLRQPLLAPEISALQLSSQLSIRDNKRPCALILSPHPDDECLMGVLPLRLRRECNWQIVNLAITLGSGSQYQVRKTELAKSCAVLGFECVLPDENSFSAVNSITRENNSAAWIKMVLRLREVITHYQPQAVFIPHIHDAHATHIGCHLLGLDALAGMAKDFISSIVQTEYWQPLPDPNLMVGIGIDDATCLLSALTCHAGEVARNPYDRRFPAYLIDNVRRGSERVGGAGAGAAPLDFAMLYKIGLWRNGKFMSSALNRIITESESVDTLFD